MIDSLLAQIAPHPCYGCSKLGTLLCDNCKNNIIEDNISICFMCGSPQSEQASCTTCKSPFQRTWCHNEREGIVKQLIDSYKFSNCYSAYVSLADLLCANLPYLPAETIIVPIPTIPSHIRQRGYDHTALLAKRAAKLLGVTWEPLLERINTKTQRGASRIERSEQAKHAFRVRKLLDPSVPYLLIDDIVTTGATMKYGAEVLQSGGAEIVWGAAIARQPLD